MYTIALKGDLQYWFSLVSDLIILKLYVFVTEQVQSFTSKPSALPKFPRSFGDQVEKAVQLRPVSLPGISSIKGKVLYHEVIGEMFRVTTF